LRAGFTIIYEGLHHLQHNDFAEKMADMFDHWIVVEGNSLPYGSTKWCNMVSVPASSQDGTIEFMEEFAKSHKNVHFYSRGAYFNSKDSQVNHCIEILRKITTSCYLWEVDADEHWQLKDIERAEEMASRVTENGFSFQFNHLLGPGIMATGDWGSGYLNRLWKWNGELFKSHEPAMLRGQRRTMPLDGVKFDHYSYYFKKDIEFKSKYYPGCENIVKNWDNIQQPNTYPMPISRLFGENTRIGRSNSQIIQR